MKKNNFVKILAVIFSTILILGLNVHEAFAKEKDIDLVTITDKYVFVENGNFILKNENLLKQELIENKQYIKDFQEDTNVDLVIDSLKERFNMLNIKAESHQITIEYSKRIVNHSPEYRAAGQSTSSYWWGVKHTFYNDDAARDYAYKVRMVAHANAGGAVIGGAVFGGVGSIPNGITAIYGYMIADSVDYNANKEGNGVILDINWWLTFSCYPR